MTACVKAPTVEQIERRAYELYVERDSENGHAVEDWLAADEELTEQPEQSRSIAYKVQAATS